MVALFCRACLFGLRPQGEIPSTCPSCGAYPARWRTAYVEPRKLATSPQSDRAFLRSIGVRCDEPSNARRSGSARDAVDREC
jgi:hypothetical protein